MLVLAKPQVQSSTEAQYSSSDSPLHEFVSDTFRATSQDIEEVREGMKKLGLDPTPVKGTESFQVLCFYFLYIRVTLKMVDSNIMVLLKKTSWDLQ